MDEQLRFLLYGTYDGFSRSTLGDDNILLVLDNGDKVEIPNHFVKNASDFVEKNQIKLRDVIARIKQLDIGAREVWLNEILNELGSDYGTLKYKDGYEQGKVEGLVEREKPVVRQFVADWYEEHKDDLEFNIWDWIKYTQEEEKIQNRQFTEWLGESENDPVETLVKMKLFGYTVEKEKRYRVKMKNAYYNKHPQFLCETDNGIFWAAEIDLRKTKFTRKELEEAGFGWVFDCPGIEIDEVENE
jgi:hypothetical protein